MDRKIVVLAILALLSVFAIAGVVTYLSNTVNATATVSSPIELTATASVNGEEQPLEAIEVLGGETIVIGTNTKNLSSVAQACDLTITASPALETSEGTLETEVIKTVVLDAYAEEANSTEIEVANAYVGTVGLSIVCNVAAPIEPVVE